MQDNIVTILDLTDAWSRLSKNTPVWVTDGLNRWDINQAKCTVTTFFDADGNEEQGVEVFVDNPKPSPNADCVTWEQVHQYLVNNGIDAVSINNLQEYINANPININVIGGE
jgi:hypothetical protein